MVEVLLDELATAIKKRDHDKLELACDKIDDYFLEIETVTKGFIENLFSLMLDDKFLSLTNSWMLFRIIAYNEDLLSQEQKKSFISLMSKVFYDLKDETTCLLCMEIIPRLSSATESLAILESLNSNTEHHSRMYVSHGLKELIESCDDALITKKALKRLVDMGKDSNPEVSNMATHELAIVSKGKLD